MRKRYGVDKSGKVGLKAVIYQADEHGILADAIDKDAIMTVRRLVGHGFNAYIVGGAVRDMLLGFKPKDFDVVTDATPRKVWSLFRNSHIIGKRFRLALLYFTGKQIEVSTFREQGGERNLFGDSMENDCRRRDFSCNGLYYSPVTGELFDYCGGYNDIQAKRLQNIIPLPTIFNEDPMRMVRAVKYGARCGLKLPALLKRRIKRNVRLLAACPASRLTEEFIKIVTGRACAEVFFNLNEISLLSVMLPAIAAKMTDSSLTKVLYDNLSQIDTLADNLSSEQRRLSALTLFFRPFLEQLPGDTGEEKQFDYLKELTAPLTLPNLLLRKVINPKAKKRKKYWRQAGDKSR